MLSPGHITGFPLLTDALLSLSKVKLRRAETPWGQVIQFNIGAIVFPLGGFLLANDVKLVGTGTCLKIFLLEESSFQILEDSAAYALGFPRREALAPDVDEIELVRRMQEGNVPVASGEVPVADGDMEESEDAVTDEGKASTDKKAGEEDSM
jgi:hypothetical protein